LKYHRENKMDLFQTILFSIGMFIVIAGIFAIIRMIAIYFWKLINISFNKLKSKINK